LHGVLPTLDNIFHATTIYRKTGEPVGIDKGWGYNVGTAGKEEGYRMLTDKFETMPYDVARKWLGSYVDEPAYAQFIEGKISGEFPVAVLNEGFRKEIGAQSQAVWLSEGTLAKNKTAHPELALDDYRSYRYCPVPGDGADRQQSTATHPERL